MEKFIDTIINLMGAIASAALGILIIWVCLAIPFVFR